MADTTYLPSLLSSKQRADTARFSVLVRVTHWLNTISFVALVVSDLDFSRTRVFIGRDRRTGDAFDFGFTAAVHAGRPSAGDGICIFRRRGCAC